MNDLFTEKQKMFMTANEIAELLTISRTQAYKIVKELNEELQFKGFRVQPGKISTKYFLDRYGLI